MNHEIISVIILFLSPIRVEQMSITGMGVVRWCEGVLYLMSPGRPAGIGLQLGRACYPCSR